MVRRRIELAEGADLAGFRRAVRTLVAERVAPDEVLWSGEAMPTLFQEATRGDTGPEAPPVSLPRPVGELIESVVCHRDPERFALLYRLVWRVLAGERALTDRHADPLVHRLERMAKSVGRDLHKMHAFLRFREIRNLDACGPDGAERFVAWFEPDHYIIERAGPFFVERFQSMVWSILTPVGALHWDRRSLIVGPPAKRADLPDEATSGDRFEEGWRRYYESTFNPARLNLTAMRSEMPKKYWANLPEAAAIPDLIRSAPARVREMIEREAAQPRHRNPDRAVAAMARQEPASLEELNRLIRKSEPLVPGGSRAVLGEGPLDAALVLVGEQPGDREDLEGRPFVGPAGLLLDRALAEAGIGRAQAYLTNAVKHFKYEQRGKVRIHQSPTAGEVKHYRWWLLKELSFLRPRLVVALGATAALALAGRSMPVMRSRGPMRLAEWPGFVTLHPAAPLRRSDEAGREEDYRLLVADLRQAAALAAV